MRTFTARSSKKAASPWETPHAWQTAFSPSALGRPMWIRWGSKSPARPQLRSSHCAVAVARLKETTPSLQPLPASASSRPLAPGKSLSRRQLAPTATPRSLASRRRGQVSEWQSPSHKVRSRSTAATGKRRRKAVATASWTSNWLWLFERHSTAGKTVAGMEGAGKTESAQTGACKSRPMVVSRRANSWIASRLSSESTEMTIWASLSSI
mmetsp:Transcript_15420/g.27341  ORF Transcript_15420/g.27341 Transcript_15420/m.27341 type:complete len:210 (-) Transcript_15420:89-718(-)